MILWGTNPVKSGVATVIRQFVAHLLSKIVSLISPDNTVINT